MAQNAHIWRALTIYQKNKHFFISKQRFTREIDFNDIITAFAARTFRRVVPAVAFHYLDYKHVCNSLLYSFQNLNMIRKIISTILKLKYSKKGLLHVSQLRDLHTFRAPRALKFLIRL